MLPLPNSIFITTTSTPIYVGQVFQAVVGYIDNTGILTQILPTDPNLTYKILNNTNNQLSNQGNLMFIPNQLGSYGIYFTYNNGTKILTNYLYVLAINPLQRLGYNQIYTILKQELPSSYNNSVSSTSGNYLDNNASVQLLTYMYSVLYGISDSQYPANGYTTNWEFALNNSNNLFLLATYPNLALNLLYQVPYQTGITRYDLTLFIAKFCYYWLGEPIVVYIDGNTNIIVYVEEPSITWTLGDAVLSLLGITTYLGNSDYDIFAVLLIQFILRYFPVHLNWTLTFSSADPLAILTDVGYTYYGDLRPIVGMKYLGDPTYPFNIIGYILTP